MAEDRKTMGAFETLWAVLGGLFLAGMLGLETQAWIILIGVVLWFAVGAAYWKLRLAGQRRQRRQQA
jgi:type IV secretory pathway TrbD component